MAIDTVTFYITLISLLVGFLTGFSVCLYITNEQDKKLLTVKQEEKFNEQ